MRKFILSLAVATSALAVAAPAAAQWAPQGNAYGYNQNYGQYRRLQTKIDEIQRQIARLDQRDLITNREARSLRNQSIALERQLRYAGRNGLNRAERNLFEQRIDQLRWRIRAEVRDGNRYGNNNRRWDNDRDGRDWDGDGRDRDRDGRDGRWDEDRDGRDWDGDGRDRDD